MSVQIPNYVKNIKTVPLSLAGEVKLSGFPPEAIREAEKSLRKRTGVDNKFAYFFRVASSWCLQNNTEPNWELVDQLKTEFGITQAMSHMDPDRPVQSVLYQKETVNPEKQPMRPQNNPEKQPLSDSRVSSTNPRRPGIYQKRETTSAPYINFRPTIIQEKKIIRNPVEDLAWMEQFGMTDEVVTTWTKLLGDEKLARDYIGRAYTSAVRRAAEWKEEQVQEGSEFDRG